MFKPIVIAASLVQAQHDVATLVTTDIPVPIATGLPDVFYTDNISDGHSGYIVFSKGAPESEILPETYSLVPFGMNRPDLFMIQDDDKKIVGIFFSQQHEDTTTTTTFVPGFTFIDDETTDGPVSTPLPGDACSTPLTTTSTSTSHTTGKPVPYIDSHFPSYLAAMFNYDTPFNYYRPYTTSNDFMTRPYSYGYSANSRPFNSAHHFDGPVMFGQSTPYSMNGFGFPSDFIKNSYVIKVSDSDDESIGGQSANNKPKNGAYNGAAHSFSYSRSSSSHVDPKTGLMVQDPPEFHSSGQMAMTDEIGNIHVAEF